MNLGKTIGLTSKQYRFLLNQGVQGQLARFAYIENIKPEELHDEKVNLKKLHALNKGLVSHRVTAIQVDSILDSTKTISYPLWAVYLYRISKPVRKGGSGSGSGGN